MDERAARYSKIGVIIVNMNMSTGSDMYWNLRLALSATVAQEKVVGNAQKTSKLASGDSFMHEKLLGTCVRQISCAVSQMQRILRFL